jgi:hypothetical protein
LTFLRLYRHPIDVTTYCNIGNIFNIHFNIPLHNTPTSFVLPLSETYNNLGDRPAGLMARSFRLVSGGGVLILVKGKPEENGREARRFYFYLHFSA